MTKALLHPLGQSLSYGRLSLLAKVLWPMLLSTSDDQGRGTAEPDAIKWYVCPNVPEIDLESIPGLLAEMQAQGMLLVYECDRDHLAYQVIHWWEYQKLRWARPSKFSPPHGWDDRIRYSNRGSISEDNWTDVGGFPNGFYTENYTENSRDFQPNLTQLNLTKPKDTNVSISSVCTDTPANSPSKPNGATALYTEMREAWLELFPDKPQPRAQTKSILSKVRTRMKEPGFSENWRAGMERASRSSFCRDGPWFDFMWFVKNDYHWQNCFNGNYDKNKGNGRGNDPPRRKQERWTIETDKAAAR